MPDSVTKIGSYTFGGCTSLKNIEMSGSIRSIDSNAFFGCESLHFNEYNNARYLGNKNNPYVVLMEMNDKTISDYQVCHNTKCINDEAFAHCTSLKNIAIPDSVVHIGNNTFSDCTSLTMIKVDQDNLNYKSIDGNLYSKDETTLIQYATGRTTESFAIPDSVTSIGRKAFYGCHSLKYVELPDSVIDIGPSAFSKCTSLTSIKMSNSLIDIGGSTFFGCESLESVTIPDSVTRIGDDAFRGCKALKSIVIPDSVTCIAGGTFYDCHSLKDVKLPNSIKLIENYAFEYCTSLESIVIPDSVTRIEKGAFCFSSLKNIEIPKHLYLQVSYDNTLRNDVYITTRKMVNEVPIANENNLSSLVEAGNAFVLNNKLIFVDSNTSGQLNIDMNLTGIEQDVLRNTKFTSIKAPEQLQGDVEREGKPFVKSDVVEANNIKIKDNDGIEF